MLPSSLADILEELSFRNLVEWHSSELERILDGEPACRVFNDSKRRSLISHGILTMRDPVGAGGGPRLLVSENAKELLGRMKREG